MRIYKDILMKYLDEGNTIQSYEIDVFSEIKKPIDDLVSFDPDKISLNLLKYIIENDFTLNPEERATLTLKIQSKSTYEKQDVFFKTKIKNLNDIINLYETNLKNIAYNFDFNIDNKPIPVCATVELRNATKYDKRHIKIFFNLEILDQFIEYDFLFYQETIQSLKAKYGEVTFESLFNMIGLIPQTIDLKKYEELLNLSTAIQADRGSQYVSTSFGYKLNKNLGDYPYNLVNEKVIIERDLILEERNYNLRNRINQAPKHYTKIPFVRVFSLSKKKYFFIHVNELKKYQYNEKAIDKLVLETKNINIINKIFSSNIESFNDLSQSKGKGIVVLAVGESGTGKTSTAEVYAEFHKKPLYILQVDELSTSAEILENNLETILNRIQAWNAVLLIDEADIFLYKRNNDLSHSAYVGVFLRLLEYFKGVIFLTSNRLDVIDDAVISRVTLVLKYPNLNEKTRAIVWQENLKTAGMSINSVKELAKIELSGRDIRNYVKLLHYMNEKKINENAVIQLINDFPKK